MKNSSASNIAKGGLLVALTLVILYASNFITFNTLFLLGLASALIPLSIIILDVPTSVMVYGTSAILSYIIIPDKTLCFLYTIVFGPYGIVKLYIEKQNVSSMEIILKLIYCNGIIALTFFLYKTIFMLSIELKYPIILGILVGNIVFFIYDYVLTVFINSMKNKRFK